jgi:anaerobic selenocysteine-containing dehydrogenase
MTMQTPVTREVRTFCRICTGTCGLVLSVDEAGVPVSVRGDRDDPHSLGYICSKGVTSVEAHTDQSRILHPLKRQPDGSFERIGLEQALTEIAAKLGEILERDGPDAIAGFRGTGGFFTTSGLAMLPAWLGAMGSHKLYTTLTIDQSAKLIAAYRIGIWPAGKQTFQSADVMMMIGGNPLVSMAQLDTRNPIKRMTAAKERGLTLIVIDPRRTETTRFADLVIQPLPGHDAEIAAALIRIILKQGWHDAEFCAEYVGDLDQLRAAVEPFTAEQVAARADIPASRLYEAAELFAKKGKRGYAVTGTGVDMGPHSNAAEHLVECLNVICGRFLRAGELIENPGLVMGRGPKPAQVIPLPRPWEGGPRARTGDYGLIGGEMVTGKLSEDITQPGPGAIRFMLNHGGNPASSVPDQQKMVDALRSLECLVSIEPVMSLTARLSHYILPPKLQFERPDLPIYLFEPSIFPKPYTRYTPPVVDVPADSEVCDEWKVMWSLAAKLGRPMTYMGAPLDMKTPPEEDDLIALTLAASPVTLDELKRHPMGYFHQEEQFALPADPATSGKFMTMPADVEAEVAMVKADFTAAPQTKFAFLMSNRRDRHRMNSMGATLPGLRKATPYNVAHMNAEDMTAQSIATGDWIELSSEHGAIIVIVEADETLRRGVVSISHGFGGLPEVRDFLNEGVSPNLLISTDNNLQTINAMPRMTAIPVNVRLSNGPTS